ncbi:MAG: cytochrome c oxidase subunit 3 [Edaphocola sp.]
MMTAVNDSQRKKIHPQKFAMWIAIGSIIMMFGGLTSGYIVREGQGNWEHFGMPPAFYASTVLILLSSLTIWLAKKSLKAQHIRQYRRLVSATFVLGIAFTILQYVGFKELLATLGRWRDNVSFQYMIVIVSVHALHIIGGVVALLVLWIKTFGKKPNTTGGTGLEIAATYWHFVDILWLYLFVFFLIYR